MSKNPYRQDREELKELLQLYSNLKNGKSNSYIEEEGFERIVDYYDEKEQFTDALEAVNTAIGQFPYSGSLLIKKADLLISLRKFKMAAAALNS